MAEPLLPELEALENTLEDLKGGRSALADLVRREHDLASGHGRSRRSRR